MALKVECSSPAVMWNETDNTRLSSWYWRNFMIRDEILRRWTWWYEMNLIRGELDTRWTWWYEMNLIHSESDDTGWAWWCEMHLMRDELDETRWTRCCSWIQSVRASKCHYLHQSLSIFLCVFFPMLRTICLCLEAPVYHFVLFFYLSIHLWILSCMSVCFMCRIICRHLSISTTQFIWFFLH